MLNFPTGKIGKLCEINGYTPFNLNIYNSDLHEPKLSDDFITVIVTPILDTNGQALTLLFAIYAIL